MIAARSRVIGETPDKAGKTWAVLDAAVSVASGTPWLGRFACQQGSVLVYAGEGVGKSLQ